MIPIFTGIVEEFGTVKNISKNGHSMNVTVKGKKVMSDLKLGDSVAVNGVCLTVTEYDNHSFIADVMPETFKSTSLESLKAGSLVNLERAIAAGERFGGHFISGHVDTVGQILKKKVRENALYIEILFPKEYGHLTILKGSIAIDGVSLTIFEKSNQTVTVSLIPHTVKETVPGIKGVGEKVNIEFDMVGKYLFSFQNANIQETKDKQTISKNLLIENGFM